MKTPLAESIQHNRGTYTDHESGIKSRSSLTHSLREGQLLRPPFLPDTPHDNKEEGRGGGRKPVEQQPSPSSILLSSLPYRAIRPSPFIPSLASSPHEAILATAASSSATRGARKRRDEEGEGEGLLCGGDAVTHKARSDSPLFPPSKGRGFEHKVAFQQAKNRRT